MENPPQKKRSPSVTEGLVLRVLCYVLRLMTTELLICDHCRCSHLLVCDHCRCFPHSLFSFSTPSSLSPSCLAIYIFTLLLLRFLILFRLFPPFWFVSPLFLHFAILLPTPLPSSFFAVPSPQVVRRHFAQTFPRPRHRPRATVQSGASARAIALP